MPVRSSRWHVVNMPSAVAAADLMRRNYLEAVDGRIWETGVISAVAFVSACLRAAVLDSHPYWDSGDSMPTHFHSGARKFNSAYIHCVRKKVNHRQYWIAVPNLNASQQNYAHAFVNISLKELQNFVRKYSLTMELLIFKYRQQNISVAVMLISAATGPEWPLLAEQRSCP